MFLEIFMFVGGIILMISGLKELTKENAGLSQGDGIDNAHHFFIIIEQLL